MLTTGADIFVSQVSVPMRTDRMRPRRQVSGACETLKKIVCRSLPMSFDYGDLLTLFSSKLSSLTLSVGPFYSIVRACRNAIEFNQLPSIGEIVPGGRDGMKLDVLVAVPPQYQEMLDVSAVKKCFPYGQVRVQIQDGGMVANHGKMIESLGDKNNDMVIVCVAVTVGY